LTANESRDDVFSQSALSCQYFLGSFIFETTDETDEKEMTKPRKRTFLPVAYKAYTRRSTNDERMTKDLNGS